MTSTFLIVSAAMATLAVLGLAPARAETPAGTATAPDPTLANHKIGAPVSHDNLTVYLIRGPSADGPVPLTLGEALAQKLFRVHETGNVSELMIENLGAEAVFLQAGDIVKGGQQDRVLTMSLLVPGNSGRMPIGAYCVEQGRWSARGTESVKTFDSSAAYMPSRKVKAAMMTAAAAPAATQPANPGATLSVGSSMPDARTGASVRSRPAGPVGADPQMEVWRSVAETQSRLALNLGGPVAAKESATSLQLALENEKLAEAKRAYVAALLKAGQEPDVVGVAFAVNGEINSADIYPSHALFAKMWTKLIDAAATEALTERGRTTKPAPDQAAVMAFLTKPVAAAPVDHEIDQNLTRSVRRADRAIAMETRTRDGRIVHRSYVSF
jgi:hypothetical protein